MPPPNPIRATGVILEQKGPRLYRAALPNGKEVLAHLSQPKRELTGDFQPGTRVNLELTSYDFSIARIAGPADCGES